MVVHVIGYYSGPMPSSSSRRRAKVNRRRGISILQRFFSENMMQTSAALAFTTLMALVTLVTLLLALADALPYMGQLLSRLDVMVQGVLLPTVAGGTIVANIGRFSHKAQQLTHLGLAVLGVTAFLLLHTIEKSFNHVWQVNPRPFLARLRLYVFVMAVWPFILGGIAALVSLAVSTSLGFFQELQPFRHFVFKGTAWLLLCLFFTFLYYAVPNAPVGGRAALIGGIVASLGFAAMQRLFELFLVSSSFLKSIYGAFAAIPIFLVWLHMSWALVLFAGLLVVLLSRQWSGRKAEPRKAAV